MAEIETIGDRIARLRRAAKIQQYKLANLIGIHPSSLNQIETGKRKPSAETVSGLARELHVSRDLIMDGKEPDRIAPQDNGNQHPQQSHRLTNDQLRESIDAAVRYSIDASVRDSINTSVQEACRNLIIDAVNAISIAFAADQAIAKPKTKRPPARGTRRH